MILRKYFRIYGSFIRTGLIAEMEFRANLVIRFIADLIWYAAQITVFEVLFLHTSKLGTWNVQQTRVFLGMVFVIDAIYMMLMSENLDHFSGKIRKGDLDLLLAKPINSQFMISLQKVLVVYVSCLAVSLAWLIYSITQLPEIEYIRLLWLFILIPCGFISLYSFRFMVATCSVIFTQADNLQFIWYSLYKLGIRPDTIYSRWLRFFIMSIVPVAFIGSVPSHFIFEAPRFDILAWVIFWTFFLLWLSNRFWNFALRQYTSASS